MRVRPTAAAATLPADVEWDKGDEVVLTGPDDAGDILEAQQMLQTQQAQLALYERQLAEQLAEQQAALAQHHAEVEAAQQAHEDETARLYGQQLAGQELAGQQLAGQEQYHQDQESEHQMHQAQQMFGHQQTAVSPHLYRPEAADPVKSVESTSDRSGWQDMLRIMNDARAAN